MSKSASLERWRVPSSARRGGCDIKTLEGADGVVRTTKTFWNCTPPRLCALRSAIARNFLSAHPPLLAEEGTRSPQRLHRSKHLPPTIANLIWTAAALKVSVA